jgi:hypothetical protein
MCLGVFSVTITKYLRLGNLSRKGNYVTQFWRLEIQGQVAASEEDVPWRQNRRVALHCDSLYS